MKLTAKILLFALLLTSTQNIFASTVDQDKILSDYIWHKFTTLSPSQRPKVALVLGGGGARGFAHIGVLKVLTDENIPIDIVVGNSVGAFVGAMYASGAPVESIEKLTENTGWNDISNFSNPSVLKLFVTGKLLSTEKMEKYLKRYTESKRFDELKVDFACIATDILTGERVVLKEGDVALAARASATIPGLFAPVEYRHRFLVDGGLSDNIPTDVAKLMGADFIITVCVSSDFSRNKVSSVFSMLTQAISIQGRQLDDQKLKLSDVNIFPKVSDVSLMELNRSRECIDAGTLAARESIAQIKKKLLEKTSNYLLLN